jgi:tyrosinase
MVGATSDPFYLGKDAKRISFEIHQPTGPALLHPNTLPRRVFLNVENLTSDTPAPLFDVYLNVPPGDHPEKRDDLYVGSLALFGLVQASRVRRNHPDNGLTVNLDVTETFHRLAAAPDWDAKTLHVSFIPRRWDDALNVRVGRVSLYFE